MLGLPLKPWGRAALPTSRQKWFCKLQNLGYEICHGSYAAWQNPGEVATFIAKPKAMQKVAILFHGTGNDLLFTWQALIEDLLAQGIGVFCFDLDGHGTQSTTVLDASEVWSSPNALEVELQKNFSEALPRIIIGYSLGALIALRALAFGQLSANHLIVMACPGYFKWAWDFAVFEAFSIFHPAMWRQALRFGFYDAVPAFGAYRRQDFPIRKTWQGSYPHLVQQLFLLYPPQSLLKQLKLPALLILGRWDRLASLASWSAPHSASVEIIDHANHFLLPFHPKTLETIQHWLKGQTCNKNGNADDQR